MKLFLSLLTALLAFNFTAVAEERILSYHADIRVYEDGAMEVIETIQVRSEQQQIKRGIYRDFPTHYKDRYGNKVVMDFNVLGITRNKVAEPFHTTRQGNGKRVYIGSENKKIASGIHTYQITYETQDQLGFFDEHDELYWNVTGNGWVFPIDKASATIYLPETIHSGVSAEGYVGRMGSKDQSVRTSAIRANQPHFEADRSLQSYEGLTIVASWPKGYIEEPSPTDVLHRTLRNNLPIVVAAVGFLAVFIYYFTAWLAVGRDPEAGVIYPQYYPPENLSPAASRFVMRMGYDNKCFSAALINLAVQGDIILEEKDKQYTVHRGKQASSIFKGEMKVLNKLLGSKSSLKLKQKNHAKIAAAIKELKKWLKKEFEVILFRTNRGYVIPGVIGTVVTIAAAVMSAGDPEIIFFAVWLTFWSFGVYILLRQCINSWRTPGVAARAGAVGISLFALPFLAAEIFVFGQLAKVVPPFAILLLIATGLLNVLFHHLLKQPTSMGRQLMDYLEGFKMYLSVAEKDQLATFDGPEKTPELFEAYLPYALALDVEEEWSEQFNEILAAASNSDGSDYSPLWYHGSHTGHFDHAMLAGAVGGALTAAISSSSTAPGSSSGGGGGGSSGGGGGGGGGGGW